jgi:hypothetical protein
LLTLQKPYTVNYSDGSGTYIVFAYSEQDAIRKVEQMKREATGKKESN